jgi:hypothetical protein
MRRLVSEFTDKELADLIIAQEGIIQESPDGEMQEVIERYARAYQDRGSKHFIRNV